MFICALHCADYEQFGKASDDADVLLFQIADTYAKKTPVRVCATTFFSHMLMGQCDTTARMYDISKNVPLKRIYLPMTRSCRTRGTSGA